MKKVTFLGIPLFALILFSFSVHLANGQEEPKVEWIARYNGPANYLDYANDIAIDRSGNVYVTGESYGDGMGIDYATVKYDRNGEEVWVARYNGPIDSHDCAIAVDLSGSVYVTGSSSYHGTRYDYTTIKYSR